MPPSVPIRRWPAAAVTTALPPSPLTASIRSHIRLGVLICVGLVVTVGAWASYASIVGAVIVLLVWRAMRGGAGKPSR